MIFGPSDAVVGFAVTTCLVIITLLTVPVPRHKPAEPVPVVEVSPPPPSPPPPPPPPPPEEKIPNEQKLNEIETRLLAIKVRLNSLEQKAVENK